MFGGWDVMIRGRIGDTESPAAGAVLPMCGLGSKRRFGRRSPRRRRPGASGGRSGSVLGWLRSGI